MINRAMVPPVRRRSVWARAGVSAARLFERLQGGEFHRLRHQPRVQAAAAQRLVETLQLVGAAENAEQAQLGTEATTPDPGAKADHSKQ